MESKERTAAILTDLLAAVRAEQEAVGDAEPQWVELANPILKPISAGTCSLKVDDPERMLAEGSRTVVRLDGEEFHAEVVELRPGTAVFQVEDCAAGSVTTCQMRIPVRDYLGGLGDFLQAQLELHDGERSQRDEPTIANSIATPWPDRTADSQELDYVLGAPGSGKTTLLIDRALELAGRGKRIGIFSYTNAAADLIFERLTKQALRSSELSTTRLGVTERAIRIEDWAAADAICVTGSVAEASNSAIVVTTAYRSLLCAKDGSISFDVVLIDEASTMPLALAWTVARLATERVLVFGDPYQLGPIAVSPRDETETPRQHFGTSPFEVDGVMDTAVKPDSRMVLREQHRLPARLAATLPPIYSGQSPMPSSEKEPASPWGMGGLLYLDTSPTDAICIRAGGSRSNAVHARLTVECIRVLLEQGTVNADAIDRSLLVITPYRAQRALICAQLRSTGWFTEKQIGSTVTTIHRAQGSERDFVLVDTAEGPMPDRPDGWTLGRLWEGKGWQSQGSRLLTTALTRAREQALVIMRRDLVGTARDPHSDGAKALPRLNAMLDVWGAPASVDLTSVARD